MHYAGLLNQTYQTKPTKPNLPNQTYQTKPSKPNPPNQTYQNKPTKTNLPNQTHQTKPNLPYIAYWNKPTKPKLLVKAVNSWVRSAFGNVYFRFEPDNDLIGFQDAWGKCWNYTWVGALCDNTDCVKDISGFLCFDCTEEYFALRPQTSHLLSHNVFIMFEVHHNHNHHHGYHNRVRNS